MPYNKQLTNLDRSVMPGNIKLRLERIDRAIARLIRQRPYGKGESLSVSKQLVLHNSITLQHQSRLQQYMTALQYNITMQYHITSFAILHHNIALQTYSSVILYSIAIQHNRTHVSISSVVDSDEPVWILAHPLIHLILSGGLENPHEVYTSQKTQNLHQHCK